MRQIEILDAAYQPHYEPDSDGHYRLVVDDGNLKSAFEKSKQERSAIKEQLDAIRADKASGSHAQEIDLLTRRYQESEERLKAIDAEGAAALEAAKLDWDGKLVEPTAKLEKAEAELDELLIDGEIHRAITAARGIPKLLAHHLRPRVKMELDADGARRIVVTDDNGNVRLDPRGEPVGVPQLVEELKLFGDPTLLRAFDRDRNGNGH